MEWLFSHFEEVLNRQRFFVFIDHVLPKLMQDYPKEMGRLLSNYDFDEFELEQLFQRVSQIRRSMKSQDTATFIEAARSGSKKPFRKSLERFVKTLVSSGNCPASIEASLKKIK